MKTFLKFTFAGSFGFLSDLATFLLLGGLMTVHVVRPLSFFVAANVTYFINKNLAFKGRKAYYYRYLLGQSKAFLLNLVIFEGMLLILDSSVYSNANYIAFIVAAPLVLVFNYAYSHFLAFR